jgi:hypothetical protein
MSENFARSPLAKLEKYQHGLLYSGTSQSMGVCYDANVPLKSIVHYH